MAHKVSFAIPKRDLGTADVVFDVQRDGAKLGKLEVSRGSVVWFPRDTTKGFKLSWEAFDSLMKERGRRAERR